MKRGIFITLEGMDNAGKSTQAALLATHLRTRGEVLLTREPGGTDIGEELRRLVTQTEDLDIATETLLLLAARREHICRRILPALQAGQWVVCDRFSDSTLAYQGGGRGVSRQWLTDCLHGVEEDLRPDLTFYLWSPPEAAAIAAPQDVFERAGASFRSKVEETYETLARDNPSRIVTVPWHDANGCRLSIAAIADFLAATVAKRFPL